MPIRSVMFKASAKCSDCDYFADTEDGYSAKVPARARTHANLNHHRVYLHKSYVVLGRPMSSQLIAELGDR